MPQGICRLCQREAQLQLSHIVPAFVYRWLRESSGNGHIRSTAAPNLRVQDGLQEHWLCADCEARLGRSEAAFANGLFHPYLQGSGNRFRYGPWLLRFCVSVSWRNLHVQLDRNVGEEFSQAQRGQIASAETTWRRYLMGEIPHPGNFRQFLLPLDRIETPNFEVPPNINRYLMRAVDVDMCHGGDSIFTYTKIGRFLVLGFINERNRNHWVGGWVNANVGIVEPRHFTLPAPFGNYLMGKAQKVREAMEGVSSRQREKIERTFRANVDQIVGSDFFEAMRADVEAFGSEAFTPQPGVSDPT